MQPDALAELSSMDWVQQQQQGGQGGYGRGGGGGGYRGGYGGGGGMNSRAREQLFGQLRTVQRMMAQQPQQQPAGSTPAGSSHGSQPASRSRGASAGVDRGDGGSPLLRSLGIPQAAAAAAHGRGHWGSDAGGASSVGSSPASAFSRGQGFHIGGAGNRGVTRPSGGGGHGDPYARSGGGEFSAPGSPYAGAGFGGSTRGVAGMIAPAGGTGRGGFASHARFGGETFGSHAAAPAPRSYLPQGSQFLQQQRGFFGEASAPGDDGGGPMMQLAVDDDGAWGAVDGADGWAMGLPQPRDPSHS